MAHVTGTELYDLQYDALWQSIANNPQLPSTTNNYTNKSLNTSSKQLIKSVNEILTKLTSTNLSFNSFTEFYNGLIGDANIDIALKTDLQKIDSNLILSLLKMYKELHGENLDAPISLPQGKTVAEILNSLNTMSEQSFEAIELIGQYQIVGLNSDGKIFVLDANTLDHAEKFVGITLEGKAIGEQCKVKVFGEITNPAWTLEIGKTYFCGLNGQISTNAMNNTWTQRIGKAKDIHTIIINAGDCILL